MISVQLPAFLNHSFNHFPSSYAMADHPFPSATASIHHLQKMASHDNFSSGSEGRPKAQSGAKRRPSRAGTRSVSTLTAAQLERKRANDREAQRAIRQRTKEHIDALERRVAELSATNETSAKLTQALKRNEELEQENSILRSRLNHALTSLSENGGACRCSESWCMHRFATDPAPMDNALKLTSHSAVPPNEGIAFPARRSSPSSRTKLDTQIRASPVTTVGPRSVPVSAVQQTVTAADAWAATYSTVPAVVNRSPSAATVSPVNNNMRWNTTHGQVTPPMAEPDRIMQSVDAVVQQPVNYRYVVDTNSRPVHLQEQATLVTYPHTSPSPTHLAGYHTRHSSAQMAPSPGYAPYQGHQSYIASSPHEDAVPMMQQATMHAQHLAFSIPPNMKTE